MEYRGRPLIHPASIAEWRSWLAAHHADTNGAWLAGWTRASGKPTLDYGQIVEEALCFGWIDGVVNKLGDGRVAQLLTPRRRGSGWSRSNKERIDRLLADGRMTDAGMRVIEAAKADGSWTLLDASEALLEPPELSAGLDANPEARRQWDAFPRSSRKALIFWVTSAKRPETRQRRIAAIVEEAAHGRRANF